MNSKINKIKIRPFPIYDVDKVIQFLDITSQLQVLLLNKRMSIEFKKTELFKFLFIARFKIQSNFENLPLIYLIQNEGIIINNLLKSILEGAKITSILTKDIIETTLKKFFGKWIFRRHFMSLYNVKEVIEYNYGDESEDKKEKIILKKSLNVDFSNINLSDGVQYIVNSFLYQNGKTIEYLDLSYNLISHKQCLIISELIESKKDGIISIKGLNLSNNKIHDSSLNNIIDFLRIIKLEEIDLSNNLFSNNGLEKLCSLVNEGLIKKIILADLKLDKSCAVTIAHCFERQNNLLDLNLENNELGPEGIGFIVNSLLENKNSTLKKINLARNKLGLEGAKHISRLLIEKEFKLEELNISDNKIEDVGTKSISNALLNNRYLKILNLSSNAINSFDKVGIHSICELIINNKCLIDLNLSSNSLDDTSVFYLGNSLKMNENLQRLLLDNNRFFEKGSIYLAECLKHNSSLKELSLRHNINLSNKPFNLEINLSHSNINVVGSDSISSNLSLPLSLKFGNLIAIDLSDNLFNSDEVKLIVSCIIENELKLRILNLSDNKIGSEGSHHLSELLSHSKINLEYLNLNDNDLEEEGGIILASSIKINKSLKELHLGSNRLGVEGVQSLFESLRNNKENKIEVLDLSRNFIGDKGIYYVNQVIQNFDVFNSKLNRIDLSNNEITDAGLKLLAESLYSNYHLKKIKLKGNKLGVKSAESIFDNLDSSDTFDRVEINFTKK